jgi:hypothetical protein
MSDQYVDFTQIKTAISIEKCVQMLGLKMSRKGPQMRGPCPACKTGDPRALAVNVDNKFYCFSEKKGGDQIALVAHVRGSSPKEAAQYISRHFNLETVSDRSPPQEPRQAEKREGCPELDYLDPIDDAVEAVGLPVSVADLIGAGFASKGTQRGRVLIPLRTREGDLLGYLGIGLDKEPVYFFPDNLSERADNVVRLKKA